MTTPTRISRKYILQTCLGTTLLVIFVDFVFLNLGIEGLLNWRFHLITALYCFSITIMNFTFFHILNSKISENLDTYKRILVGLIGSVLVTMPTIFICRFIHLTILDSSLTPTRFIKNEKMHYYLFPLLFALLISLFVHVIFLLKAFQNTKTEIPIFNYFGNMTLNKVETSKTDEYAKQLIRLLSEDKYYRDPNLDLLILSRKLGLSRRKTSSVIQKVYHKQFSDCINDFRLEDVLHKFKNQKHRQFTIRALATEAGFSSKSTFYRYFKKKMGLSPSEFLEQNSLPRPNK